TISPLCEMKKPEPSEVGAGPGRPGRPRKNSSKPGGSPSREGCCTASGRWRTEMETTAGRTRSIKSAKLPGAPPGGATAVGLISWAVAESSVGAANPANRARAAPPAIKVRRRYFIETTSVMNLNPWEDATFIGGLAQIRFKP